MALDDKYDELKKLIDTGKEKGYLTYDQVNDLIPHDVHSPEDLDDLLTTIDATYDGKSQRLSRSAIRIRVQQRTEKG